MTHPMQPQRTAPGGLGPNAAHEWLIVFEREFDDAMSGGACVFGDPHALGSGLRWENDQWLDVFAAVGKELQWHTKPESIGIAVLRAVAEVANDYASAMADEAAVRVREDDDTRADDEWDREEA